MTGPFTEQSQYHTDTITTGLYPEQARVTECEHLSSVPKLTGAMEQRAGVWSCSFGKADKKRQPRTLTPAPDLRRPVSPMAHRGIGSLICLFFYANISWSPATHRPGGRRRLELLTG